MNRKEQLLQMLEEDPKDVFLHYALGMEFLSELKYQEALEKFQYCTELDETYVGAYYQLGSIFTELDIVDVAKKYIEKGIHFATQKQDRKAVGELRQLLDNIDD